MNDTVGGASSRLRKSDWGSRQAGVKLLCCLSPSGGHGPRSRSYFWVCGCW